MKRSNIEGSVATELRQGPSVSTLWTSTADKCRRQADQNVPHVACVVHSGLPSPTSVGVPRQIGKDPALKFAKRHLPGHQQFQILGLQCHRSPGKNCIAKTSRNSEVCKPQANSASFHIVRACSNCSRDGSRFKRPRTNDPCLTNRSPFGRIE